MPNKYVGAFKFLTQGARKGKVAPTITQPRQLKKTMKDIRSKYESFGFEQAKGAKDRANIVRTKKSIERMDKLDALQTKRKEGVKAKKEIKRMIDTNQADKVGRKVFHRTVEEKKAIGGSVTGNKLNRRLRDAIDKLENRSFKKKLKTIDKMVYQGKSDFFKKPQEKLKKSVREKKFMGGLLGKDKKKDKKKEKSIKDKIVDPKKKKRLEELRKELGMKKGGKAKFPDLTGDGKVTRADILKGRGVFRKGGASK